MKFLIYHVFRIVAQVCFVFKGFFFFLNFKDRERDLLPVGLLTPAASSGQGPRQEEVAPSCLVSEA